MGGGGQDSARAEGVSGTEMRLMALRGIGEVRPGTDIAALILGALGGNRLRPEAGDVIVIAQKIVSKAEDRFVDLSATEPGEPALALAAATGKPARLVQAVLDESRAVLRHRRDVLIVEDRRGFVLANAGIDASNAGGDPDRVLALPLDPDGTARRIRLALEAAAGVPLAVIINDSWGRPFRLGTVGTAIGASGLAALQDRCGTSDRDGRRLMATHVALADELAAAASILMGAGAEGLPVVVIRGAPNIGGAGCAADLLRPVAEDMFRGGPQ